MFAKMTKHQLIENDMQLKELADKLEIGRVNLTQKMKRDDFRESDMLKIAAALDCELVLELKPKEK